MKKIFKSKFKLALTVLGGCTAVLGGFFLYPSPIRPTAWTPTPALPMMGILAPNDALRNVELIGKGRLNNPEDVAFDKSGRMYVGSRDIIPGKSVAGKADVNPRIERVTFNSDGTHTIEEFVKLPGGGPLDLRFDAAGNLIVASWGQGLISISPNRQVKVLVADGTIIDGKPFGYADGVAIASDGRIFFTQGTSGDYQGLSSDILTILEGSFKGRLLEYNPVTGKSRTIIPELTFGNGVALAPDESYVLVADQYRYRIKRYWLKGDLAGKEDIFADNLPGFVHNIYIDDKNILWAAFNSPRAEIIPHNNPWLKAQLAKLPASILAPEVSRDESRRGTGFVIAMDLKGNPLLSLHNPPMSMNTLSTAVYHDGYVYLGTITGGPIIRYRLRK